MFVRILSLSLLALLVGAEDLSARDLADNNNNNNNNNNGAYNNVDYSFLSKFSLKFEGCYNVPQFFPYRQGQNNNNQNNNNNNNKRLLGGGGGGENQQKAGLYSQPVIAYKLCSGNAVTLKSTCTGPQYVTDLGSFANAYTEAKMTQDTYTCEKLREQADSNGCASDADPTTCEQAYFNKTGNAYCIQTDLEANFNVQKYLYCQKYNAYNGVNYYIGPTCSSDGKSVYLGLFTDQYCTQLDTSGAFYAANGYSLPFSSKSLVSSSFYSCVDKYYALNNMCTNLYPISAKCETSKDVSSPTTSGCNYVNKVDSLQSTYVAKTSSGGAAKGFAWIFFFTTVALAAYCYTLMKKTGKKVGMLGNDGFA